LRRLPRRTWQTVAQRLYRDPDPSLDRTCLIAGGARSGTAWLAELVASRASGRLVFEPFQSEIVSGFKGFHCLQYVRADDEDARLLEFSRRVFSVRIRDPWFDKYVEVIGPRTRVVKEIRANLMLRWLHLQFPSLPLVFIIRHPCAVVASRLALGWPCERDLESMLAQDRLRDDFLSARAAAIEAARSPVAKHALIWCLTHSVPLSKFPPEELGVVFHEDLCVEPERQLGPVFERIGHPEASAGAATGRSSMTARAGSGAAVIDRWRNELSKEQIQEVRSVVNAFGLDHLYADGDRPTKAARRCFGIA
jgi:hypothetical protein